MKKTLSKHERLTRKSYFDALFSKGKSLKSFPLRVVYLEFLPENFEQIKFLPENSQVAFSVPKRKFKRATDRNRIKRQMREAYRLNKSILQRNLAVVFIYLPHEKLDFDPIEKAMIQSLKSLNRDNSE